MRVTGLILAYLLEDDIVKTAPLTSSDVNIVAAELARLWYIVDAGTFTEAIDHVRGAMGNPDVMEFVVEMQAETSKADARIEAYYELLDADIDTYYDARMRQHPLK